MRPYVIGIAGGTGSGKTTVARGLVDALADDEAVLIEQDCYYRDLSHMTYEQRCETNFDHPSAIDLAELGQHINLLVEGVAIHKPRYDFAKHVRFAETDRVEPRPIVIVEGILVLVDDNLRERFDLKVFVDTDADIRIIRRIRRDLEQRGRTFAQIRKQYYESVRPMHIAFVEPSKRYADVIIPEGGQNRVALDLILSRVREIIREQLSGS